MRVPWAQQRSGRPGGIGTCAEVEGCASTGKGLRMRRVGRTRVVAVPDGGAGGGEAGLRGRQIKALRVAAATACVAVLALGASALTAPSIDRPASRQSVQSHAAS